MSTSNHSRRSHTRRNRRARKSFVQPCPAPSNAMNGSDLLKGGAKMKTLKIEYLATTSLTAHPRNSRKHTPKQVDQIAASIDRFGFNCPILIDRQNQIIAGLGRHLAAVKLKLPQVPVVRLEHLTEAQRRAFMIAATAWLS